MHYGGLHLLVPKKHSLGWRLVGLKQQNECLLRRDELPLKRPLLSMRTRLQEGYFTWTQASDGHLQHHKTQTLKAQCLQQKKHIESDDIKTQ